MTPSGRIAGIVGALIAALVVVASAQAPTPVTVVGQTVDEVSGLPVAGAEVVLNSSVTQGLTFKATSSEDGRFVFDRVPSGTYYVFASKAGFFMAALNDALGRGGSDELVVAWPGPPPFTLRLRPHAMIMGTVRDDDGNPVAGAKVTPLERTQEWRSWGKRLVWTSIPDVKTSVTDERGRYVLNAMDPGEYLVEIDATAVAIAGSTPRTFGVAFAPGERAIGNAVPVSLALGGQSVADVRMSPLPLFAIRGVVEMPGPNTTSVAIQLFPTSDTGKRQRSANDVWIRTATSFEFPRIPPGDYLLEVSGDGGFWGEQPVTVDDRDVSNVHLMLVPPVVVTGRVVWEGTDKPPAKEVLVVRSEMGEYARLLPAQPTRLAGMVAVGARPSGQGPAQGAALWAADGTFTLTIRPGHFLAEDAHLNGWFLKSFRINGHEALDEPVDIDSYSSGAVLTLTRSMGEVRGTIVDAAGRPDPGSMVLLFSTNARLWPGVFARTPHVLEDGCDRLGHFRLPDVLPGEYYLAAAPILPWDRLDEEVLRGLVPSAVRIRVQPGVPVVRDVMRVR